MPVVRPRVPALDVRRRIGTEGRRGRSGPRHLDAHGLIGLLVFELALQVPNDQSNLRKDKHVVKAVGQSGLIVCLATGLVNLLGKHVHLDGVLVLHDSNVHSWQAALRNQVVDHVAHGRLHVRQTLVLRQALNIRVHVERLASQEAT